MNPQSDFVDNLSSELTHVEFSERSLSGGNYVSNYESELQSGGNGLSNYEKDFYAIFNKAKLYRQRVEGLSNDSLTGGGCRSGSYSDTFTGGGCGVPYDSLIGSAKRAVPKSFNAMLGVADQLRKHFKSSGEKVAPKDVVGLAWFIIKTVQQKLGSTEVNDNVTTTADNLIKTSLNTLVSDYYKSKGTKAEGVGRTSTKTSTKVTKAEGVGKTSKNTAKQYAKHYAKHYASKRKR